MIDALIEAGHHLAEALRRENEALAALDLSRAAELAKPKVQATDAFTAAFTAARHTGARVEGEARSAATAMAARLEALSVENRRLLERAVDIQSRVIETIAGAARPGRAMAYGPVGRMRNAAAVRPMAVATRA